jgi:6-phosphogluconolactonase
MTLHTYKNVEELSEAIAKWITDMIADTLRERDRFTIALSGGSTPQRLYKILAAAPYKNQVDWSKLHIFWGDERDVPFEDSRNNAKMAYDSLLNFVPIPASQIHVMRTDIPASESATEYEKILHRYFDAIPGGGDAAGSPDPLPTSFDLVLLGLGDNAHTLSLFPGTEVVHEEQAWVKAFFLQEQNMNRITLTKTIVNKSAAIAFMVAGSEKAPALKEVLKGAYRPDLYPAQVIRPVSGQLHWFVDEAAAGLS